MSALIGFALKAGQVVKGFSAVQRSILQQKIQIVLIDATLGKSSVNKIRSACRRGRTPAFVVQRSGDHQLSDISGGIKILGLRRGNIAAGFVDKLKQEYQWL